MKNKKSKYSLLRLPGEISFESHSLKPEEQFRVLEVRDLTESSYVIRFSKNSFKFRAGQHLTLGLPGDNQIREYSIYCNEHQPWLEVLIREVEEGMVSRKLHRVKPGDLLKVDGPFGFFTINEGKMEKQKFLFIASGTGIAPFHSITGTYPELDYTLLHGIRYAHETYERQHYPADRYIACTSRDPSGDFHGRVTDYLMSAEIDSDCLIYLCGNCDMIYEAYDLLTSQGINADRIKTEVYF